MEKAAEALYNAEMAHAQAKANLLNAQLARSVSRHSMREHYRQQAALAGEKVTEARLEDLSVGDQAYKDACANEIKATLAEGESYAEVRKAQCIYEIEKAKATK